LYSVFHNTHCLITLEKPQNTQTVPSNQPKYYSSDSQPPSDGLATTLKSPETA